MTKSGENPSPRWSEESEAAGASIAIMATTEARTDDGVDESATRTIFPISLPHTLPTYHETKSSLPP